MTRTDDNHRVAKIIKGLEERIADLEERDRDVGTPNLLRTFRDAITVADQPPETESVPLEPLLWNDAYAATALSSSGYGDSYGTDPYGGSEVGGESVFGNVADSGWHTGTWGSY